ncbi:hypothetical protein T492DRAFT_1052397 [Pavlovales sp. CCMP2436]|nr:hypothetical protein T492DRAFT_1052397 [Pavlovales sp. CCMP2436]
MSTADGAAAMSAADGTARERVSIKVTGPQAVLAKLAGQCRMEAGVKRGLTGVIYGLGDGKLEIVSEGKRVGKFVEWVEGYLKVECAKDSCTLATVEAKGMGATQALHTAQFPLINVNTAASKVTVRMTGDRQTLDYTLRHCKIEAGFNRKLDWTGTITSDTELLLSVSGPAAGLKSFVRWCKRGPPMQRPDSVSIDWADAPKATETMNAAYTDEGVGA